MPVEFTVEQQALQRLSKSLRAQANGKAMRRELLKNLRTAMEPAKSEAKASIAGMPSKHDGSLRGAISRAIGIQVRLSGRSTGVKIRTRDIKLRGFTKAPRWTNRGGWRHPTFGREPWVQQSGKPGWFDRTVKLGHGRYRAAIDKAMQQTIDRVKKFT